LIYHNNYGKQAYPNKKSRVFQIDSFS